MARTVTPPNHTLLTVYECQLVLRCSNSQVHSLIKKGELASIKSGRLVRVPSASLLDWIASHYDRASQSMAQSALDVVTERIRQEEQAWAEKQRQRENGKKAQ